MFVRPILMLLLAGVPVVAVAADSGPPMFDIARQCDAVHRKNASAMSECVVGESEARAVLLQNWSTYPEATAQKCVAASRKASRLPYAALSKCLSGSTAAAGKTAVTPAKTAGPPAK